MEKKFRTRTRLSTWGGNVNNKGDVHQEVSSRIATALVTAKKLREIWNNTNTSRKWKARVYSAVILTQLTYGLETAPLTQADNQRLDTFYYRGIRAILGVKHSYWSRVSNAELLRRLNEGLEEGKPKYITVSQRLRNNRVKLFAHYIRALTRDDFIAELTFDLDMNRQRIPRKRRVGKPRVKWYAQALEDTIQFLIDKGIRPDILDFDQLQQKFIIAHLAVERKL